jgi:glycosyltransferase involved in cell wall biosynthesis
MAVEPRPLRILMILDNCYPAVGGGGAESQVRTLVLYLKRLGHRVTILTPKVPYGRQMAIERIEGIPVVRIPYPYVRGIGSLTLWLRFVWFLRHHGRRYDAWHAHIAHYIAALACATGPALGKPVVLKVSGWWELRRGVLERGRGLAGAIARRWLRMATAVQAISRRIAGELSRHGFSSDRVFALPNAVDTARFSARAPNTSEVRSFLYVGRLVREKGLDTLLDAWADVFGGSGKARLVLVGDGPLREALAQQAKARGIAADVEFAGHRANVEDYVAAADVGVLPSLIEGLSNTLLEFMAAGMPAIASRVSGSEDMVVTGTNGWLFEPGDREALAKCLAEAATVDRERLRELGQAARAQIARSASLEVVVGKLLALYRGARPAELGAVRPIGEH